MSVALLFVIAIRLNQRKTQALNLAAGLIRINQHIGEMIQERTEELAHTNMRLRELLYIVAHELKAPISGIALTVSGLLNQKKQNPEKLGQSFRSILKTAENMLLLVRNFLTTDDSQELVLANSPMLVQEIVQSAAVNLQLFAKAHNVFLRVKPMKINILMDRPDYLRQILENLIGNAIKHSSKTKKPLVEIGVNSNENRFLEIRITNSGNKLTTEQLKPLWESNLLKGKSASGFGIGVAVRLASEVKMKLKYRYYRGCNEFILIANELEKTHEQKIF